jgi:hypothetical protein
MRILGVTASGFDAGDYELITTVFPNGTIGSVVFNSIPQNYRHLQIRYSVRNNEAFDSLRGFFLHLFNSSQDLALGNNYRSHMLSGNGSTVSSSAQAADWRIAQDVVPANNSTANSFGSGVIDILDYTSTTKNKTVRWFAGSTASSASRVAIISGARFLTDAVSSITAYSNGNFVNGSRVSLYGIRG